MSMKKSNDTIGNRTRDLPACSALPQPTAPPSAPTAKHLGEIVQMCLMNKLGAIGWCNKMVSMFVVCMHVTAHYVK